MKPIPVLGIPHFNRPDLLARCIASIDYPVETLVIIQNGPDEEGVHFSRKGQVLGIATNQTYITGDAPRECHRIIGMLPANLIANIHIIKHPNSGCAGAWNEIIKLFPADWWMITNNDIQFAPGDLGKMAEFVESSLDRSGLALAYGNHAASWFSITSAGVRLVGLFDENIYPAYLEDCDWHYRANRACAIMENVPDVHAVHGHAEFTGSCTIMSDTELRQKNGRTHGGNFEYYRQKWGGINGEEKYLTPFDLPGVPVSFWTF